MPQPIRFHLDENLAHAVAHGLRLYGLDVTTTPDARLLQAADQTQLDFATKQARVMVTCDKDFLALAAHRTGHAGIVFAEKNRHRHGDLVRGLVSLAARFTAEQMTGSVVYLSELLAKFVELHAAARSRPR